MVPEWISEPERLDEVSDAWDELAAASGTPFTSHAWLAAWWDAFGGSAPLRVCAIWDGDRIVAGTPLYGTRRRLRTLTNYHTPALPALATGTDALSALASALVDERAAQIFLEDLPHDEMTGRLLERLRAAPRTLVHVQPLRTSPIVDTAGDFAEWRTATKSRWGAPLERFRRKAGREQDMQATLVERPTDLDAELSAGLRLEAGGWKGEHGTAILSSADTERFYREVARRFNARDELRLSAVRFGDRLVAFDLCLLHAGRLYLLKTAYDESQRKLAPGLVLRLSAIERCFELGLEAFELLGGEDDWKLKFSTSGRAYLGARVYRTSPTGLGAYAYRRALRPVLRRGYQAARRALPARGG